MRVLIADKLADRATVRLTQAGLEVRQDASLSGDLLTQALAAWRPEILVVRSTRVERAHTEASSALSLVVRAGAGVNTIDLEAAADHGVFVANCPGKNSVAVAELTMALMLAVDRHLPAADGDLKRGHWNKKRYSQATGLAGRTLGILGVGGIGRAVIQRARAFDLDVVAWSRSLTAARADALGVRLASSPLDLAHQAGILTVHLALNPDTQGIVDDTMLQALGDDGVLINTSRADVVDRGALFDALNRGLHAGLDVFHDEPKGKEADFDDAIARHENVVGSHHIGASTTQAQHAVADAVTDIICAFKRRGHVPNCVNLAEQTQADHVLMVRHHDQVGVLAAVLDHLRQAQINVQEMENRIFAGGRAASARIQVTGEIPSSLTDQLLALDHVLNVSLVPVSPES